MRADRQEFKPRPDAPCCAGPWQRAQRISEGPDARRSRSQETLGGPHDWSASQAYGERLRAGGEDGIAYDSLRHVGGVNVVAYDPRRVLDVTIGPSFDLIVPIEGKIVARRLA
jgi:hypothetical protein